MAISTTKRGVFISDTVLVSDIIHGSKPSLGITAFRNITDQLASKPVELSLANDHERGDYWTDGTSYMVVSGKRMGNMKWRIPINDQIQGGGGGLTPQQLQALRSKQVYARNTIYHPAVAQGEAPPHPIITNITARANNQAVFESAPWTHSQDENSVYKADVLILASGAGDAGATAIVATIESIPQIPDVPDAANVKPFADASRNPTVQVATGDIADNAVTETKLSSDVRTKLNAEAPEPTAVKPYAASDGRDIEGGDIADNTIPEGKLDDATRAKLDATGGADDSLVQVGISGDGPETFLTSRTRGSSSSNRVGFRSVSEGGTEGQVFTKGANNLFGWEDLPDQNVAQWAKADDSSTQIPDSKISNTFARESVVEEQLALLDLAINANVLPRQLRAYGGDLQYIPHPEGVWGQRDDSTVGMNIGGAFLFNNDKTTTKGIPNEVGATTATYSVANIPAAPNPNFVREHADPNEDSNPFLGVTPYCNGPVIVTTPTNERRKVFTGIWGQQLATRPTETALDIDNTMFSIGSKGLIRWNREGIEVRTGADSAINRQVTQYIRIGTQNLTNLGNAAYTPAALASTFTGASQTFRLVANLYDADESVPRQSPSIDIEANASSKDFIIPLANRPSVTGNITYNGSTRVATINITGGGTAPDTHIDLDVRVRQVFTYNRPSRTTYEALVLSDDVVRPGVGFKSLDRTTINTCLSLRLKNNMMRTMLAPIL